MRIRTFDYFTRFNIFFTFFCVCWFGFIGGSFILESINQQELRNNKGTFIKTTGIITNTAYSDGIYLVSIKTPDKLAYVFSVDSSEYASASVGNKGCFRTRKPPTSYWYNSGAVLCE